jgi:hypothetical protein
VPSPGREAGGSGPVRIGSPTSPDVCPAAGLTGADGVFPAPGAALAGACVRGLSGELACGALDSGVRVGDSGLGPLPAGSDGL